MNSTFDLFMITSFITGDKVRIFYDHFFYKIWKLTYSRFSFGADELTLFLFKRVFINHCV